MKAFEHIYQYLNNTKIEADFKFKDDLYKLGKMRDNIIKTTSEQKPTNK